MTGMASDMASADLASQVIVERIDRDSMSLRALATLRMTVFRSWPYLYDGSADYEANYLSQFFADDAATLIVARVGEIPVGMATASPMSTQSGAIKEPFLAAGVDIETLFYFGESVLLPQFRGQGIGHRFFDERETAATGLGGKSSVFCAVMREDDHPQRPKNARDLTQFWQKRGYRIAPRFETRMLWKEVGQKAETSHRMQFWMKSL